MKIPPAQINNFIQSLKEPSEVKAILLYGPDEGVIKERNRIISSSITDISDPFNFVEVHYDVIKNDPAWLADEMAALSFSGKRRLIKVTTTSTGLDNTVKEILTKAVGEAFVLFLAGNLPPSSVLRKYFEQIDHLAAIPCYVEDAIGVRKYINQTLKGKFSLEPEALDYIQQACTGNRQLIMSELDKLMTYMGNEQHIRYEDVVHCMGKTADSSLNELCFAVMSCDSKATNSKIQMVRQSGIAAIAIIRSLMYYVVRLHNVKSQMALGASDKKAMAALRPPVFFKDISLFKKHLALWSLDDLERLLHSLEKCERESKKTAMPVDILCSQLIAILPFYRNSRKRAV